MKTKISKHASRVVRSSSIFCLAIACLVSSCQKDSPLETALKYAGNNRAELEKVLEHYKDNPEKREAARFLIENMVYHYTIESPTLTAYYQAIDSINRTTSQVNDCKQKYDSLYALYGDPKKDMVIREDIKYMTSAYLIENIEHAFKQWKEGSFAQHLSFDDFCEYLLPYRIGTENLVSWRDTLENKYLHRIQWLEKEDNNRNSSYWAALYLNDQIKNRGFYLEDMIPSSPVDHPPLLLANMKIGSCFDYAKSAVFIMRACGIPVNMDYTPQWPFRSHNHAWNVVLETCTSKDVSFMGGESNPGYPNKPAYKIAKVYRNMFAYQKESLFDIKGKETVPRLFNNPFIKDMSDQYFNGADVHLKLPKQDGIQTKFAYLAVFDNQQWTPIQWGKITSGQNVCFKKMGKSIVYLPIYYIDNIIRGAHDPILLNYNGNYTILTAHPSEKIDLILTRKFPVWGHILHYSARMINGKFEASNHPSFKDAVEIGVINRSPFLRYDTLTNHDTRAYRYWRYVSPTDGYCNIAELEFIKDHQNIASQGKILINLTHTESNIKENAFDGDGLTYYESSDKTLGWIGLDFGKPVLVDYIRYLPRNDDNGITAGNQYELFYWGKNNWQSLGITKPSCDSLVYNKVPAGALYLLKNHTKGKEERIFTYENGKQVWW